MKKEENALRFAVLTLLVILAGCTRALPLFIPHIWNFTAVGALAVFAGSQFRNKFVAMLIPLAAMAISDQFLGNGFDVVVYLSFMVMVLCGVAINGRTTVTSVGLASIVGAVLFFLITNLNFVYDQHSLYPHNFQGIVASYVAGLPFLRNMLIGDAIYGTILFGTYYALQLKFPKLAMSRSQNK